MADAITNAPLLWQVLLSTGSLIAAVIFFLVRWMNGQDSAKKTLFEELARIKEDCWKKREDCRKERENHKHE
jgi:hypothetical protein